MTWRTIASSEVDPDSPVTATLMEALADNPEAIASGDSGAPRIKVETAAGTAIDVPVGSFGAMINLGAVDGGGGGAGLTQIRLSDDGGSTHSAVFTLGTALPANDTSFSSFQVDFTTGAIRGHFDSGVISGTVTLPAGTVDRMLLTITGAGAAVNGLAQFNGGDV